MSLSSVQKETNLASPMFADPSVDEGKAGGSVQGLGQRGTGPGDMTEGYGHSPPSSHCWWDTPALVDSMSPWAEAETKHSKAVEG